MIFNPKQSRQQLKNLVIPIAREPTYEEAFRNKRLGSNGTFILSTAIESLIVGYFDVAKELLAKARTFLRAATEHKIDGHPGRGIMLDEFAFSRWALERREDVKSLKESVAWTEGWFGEKKHLKKLHVQVSLGAYLEGKQYETLIRRFESVGLSSPKNLRRIQGEGTMCYVMARHRLGLDYTDEEIEAALNTFLKRRVGEWMRGHYTSAARWMKIAHWKPGDDPTATILRVYDYLPEIEPPKYPPKPVISSKTM